MDKKLALVKRIIGKYYYKPKYKAPVSQVREYKLNKLLGKKYKEPQTFLDVDPNSVEHKDRLFVYNYFNLLGLNEEEMSTEWFIIKNENKFRRGNYNLMPKQERKDNQNPETNTINYGSGGGNAGWLRVPSKKHKNRYKNFLKLFPHFKNN